MKRPAKAKNYKDLIAWQKSVVLVKSVYSLIDELPHTEEKGLKDQLRRSSISIPSNIAEGSRRGSRKDFQKFLRISSGSLAELETQILIVKELYYLQVDQLLQDINEIAKILNGLISSLKSSTET